ncbi:hypothetical protein BH10CYA1_BH10CYA1_48350 [soil metagenome]
MNIDIDSHENQNVEPMQPNQNMFASVLRAFKARDVSRDPELAWLVVYDRTAAKAKKFYLTDVYFIGRSDMNSLSINNDGMLSRIHAVITKIDAAYFIRDLRSTNGTYVNDNRVSGRTRLRSGDKIFLGMLVIVFWEGERPIDFSVDQTEFNPSALSPTRFSQPMPTTIISVPKRLPLIRY